MGARDLSGPRSRSAMFGARTTACGARRASSAFASRPSTRSARALPRRCSRARRGGDGPCGRSTRTSSARSSSWPARRRALDVEGRHYGLGARERAQHLARRRRPRSATAAAAAREDLGSSGWSQYAAPPSVSCRALALPLQPGRVGARHGARLRAGQRPRRPPRRCLRAQLLPLARSRCSPAHHIPTGATHLLMYMRRSCSSTRSTPGTASEIHRLASRRLGIRAVGADAARHGCRGVTAVPDQRMTRRVRQIRRAPRGALFTPARLFRRPRCPPLRPRPKTRPRPQIGVAYRAPTPPTPPRQTFIRDSRLDARSRRSLGGDSTERRR